MANLLVTNDDGVESKLWSGLCAALEKDGHTVFGLAPAADRSWIGCAQTLGRELMPTEIAPRRWSLDGTPCDCVAIAPAFLGIKIDAVISGINIGVNTRLPLILTSGTVGAASTGAMLGLRAIAFSYAIPREFSAEAKKQGGIVPQTAETTEAMLAHCAKRVNELLTTNFTFGRVINVNFPAVVTASTAWEEAPMALAPIDQYFKKTDNGTFLHDVKLAKPLGDGRNEFLVIGEGKIAETLIDWPKICEASACIKLGS